MLDKTDPDQIKIVNLLEGYLEQFNRIEDPKLKQDIAGLVAVIEKTILELK